MTNTYTAVILAGQIGDPGLLKEKAGGKSILSHSLDVFDADELCEEIIVECSPEIREWIATDPLTFSIAKMRLEDAKGGFTESCMEIAQSVKSAVLVFQDAAFPSFGAELLTKVLATVKSEIAAVPGWQVYNYIGTVTSIEGRGADDDNVADSFLGSKSDHRRGHLMELADLSGLHSLQFPQVFSKDSLLKAGEAVADKLAEYGSLCEMYIAGGFEVAVIDGRRTNIGLFIPDDLYMLRKLIGGGAKKKKDRYGGLGW